jgi:hypothetical protein
MARIWASGFELGNNKEFANTLTNALYSTTTVRSGNYSGEVSALVSGNRWGWNNSWSGGGNSNAFQSIYMYVEVLPSAENTFIAFVRTSTIQSWITLGSDGLLRLYDEDGVIGDPSAAVPIGSWFKIDLRQDTTPAAGSHVIEARLNNTVFATSSTRSIALGSSVLWCGGNLLQEAQTVGEWYFDDWKVNDDQGSFETSYPGEGKIIHLMPNAAGDNADWARGGDDSGANFSQVDEVPPNDVTDYVSSNTLDNIDDHNIDTVNLAPLDTINLVAVCFRARAGASSNATFVLRFKATNSGESATSTPNSATWRTNRISATPVIFQYVIYEVPSTTDPLTVTDLETAQIGYRLSTSDANAVEMSTVWLTVDYTPASPIKTINGLALASVKTVNGV